MLLVQSQNPIGDMQHDVDERGDREAARDFTARGSAHSIGHDRDVTGLVEARGEVAFGQIRQQRVEMPSRAGHEKVILVGVALFAFVRLRGDVDANQRRGRPHALSGLRKRELRGVELARIDHLIPHNS